MQRNTADGDFSQENCLPLITVNKMGRGHAVA
jgi:hypothetical protein